MNINEIINEKAKETEKIVYSFLPKEEGFQKNIITAMNYSMKSGGKRLRPMLIKEFYHLFDKDGKNYDAVCHFMAAIEMIHTYSLVHDDLPAMDNDEYRRGKKTTHVEFGYAQAILAGDGLLNYAYEVAADSFNDNNETEAVIKALKVLTRKPGLFGMLGGQAVDVENDDKTLDEDTLSFIYELKTGALIEASMMIGAILAGADEECIKTVEKIAYCIGMAFQIQDDILDVTSTIEQLGKPVNSDDKNNKTTYVTIYGVSGASKKVSDYSNQAVELLNNLPGNNEIKSFIADLFLYLVNRSN